MKPEEQRIAIAEACGWRFHSNPNAGQHGSWLPYYVNDLNAMHDAWETLAPSQKVEFENQLYQVVMGDAEYHRNDDQPFITNAIAAQRAEAFLKTLDLWKP